MRGDCQAGDLEMVVTASPMSEHPCMLMLKKSLTVAAFPAYHPSWCMTQASLIVASLPPYSPQPILARYLPCSGVLPPQSVLAPIAATGLPNLLDSDCQCSLVQPVFPHPMLDQTAVVIYLDLDIVHLMEEYFLPWYIPGVLLVAHLSDHLREMILSISLSLTEWSDSSYFHVLVSVF